MGRSIPTLSLVTLLYLSAACGGDLASSSAAPPAPEAGAPVDAAAPTDATLLAPLDAASPPDARVEATLGSPSDAHVPPFPMQTPRVVAGGDDTCYRSARGHVACWGSNETGQLGVGDFTDRWTPTWLPGVVDVTDLTLGDSSLCVRHLDGSIACAGMNQSGELGAATPNCPALGYPCSDALVNGPSLGPGALASGVAYACAAAVGGLRCWGAAPPFDATGYETLGVAAGDAQLCARFAPTSGEDHARNVVCFGASAAGQLGTGFAGDASAAGALGPVARGPAGGFVEIAAGDGFTCGVGAGGELLCWGDDTYGALGLGPGLTGVCLSAEPEGELSTPCAPEPTAVTGLPPISHVAARFVQACAVATTGAVYCWGTPSQTSPASAGSCAITTAGCAPPSVVPGVTDATSIAVGLGHACAITAGGAITCWGLDTHGQLGRGMGGPTVDPTPVAVVLPPEP